MNTQVLTTDSAALDILRRRGMVAAVAGLVVGGIGAVLQPSQIMGAWLIGFYFCLSLSLGSLALLMTQHMSGGAWGLVARRIFEAGASLLPFCLLLFVPVAIFAPKLYIWLH